MSLLARCFREQVKKMKDPRMSSEHEFDVSYSTGFLSFDFLNGTIVKVKREDGEESTYSSIGLVDGSITTIIGRSGCGKTTFAVQTARNIIAPFEDANMYIDSVEGGLSSTRLSTLTGWTGKELRRRVVDRNTGVTAENFYMRIKLIHDIKLEHRDEMSYNTGKVDDLGNPIVKLIPTPYILDSLAMLMPEKYSSEDELSGQMAATAAAKTNTQLLKRIVPMIKAANILLFLINHINQKVEINPYAQTKSQLSYLKPGETMPGGNAAIYLANNIIRFDDTKLKIDEFGVEAYKVTVTLMKSRTAAIGATKEANLIFCQQTGFDADLSLFTMLRDADIITNAGAYYSLRGSAIKFTRKGFKEKLETDLEFRKEFIQASLNYLQTTLMDSYRKVESYNSYSLTDEILSMMNAA